MQWLQTAIEQGDFGAHSYKLAKKEFAHIHSDSELDIVFGKAITKQLLDQQLVQKHLYVPAAAISYKINDSKSLEFGMALLTLAYLLQARKLKDAKLEDFIAHRLQTLRPPLPAIYHSAAQNNGGV